MPFLTEPVQVRAPATSANLGPGFDCLGLALALHDEVGARVTASDTTVEVHGEGAGELPTDATHLVIRAMAATFAQLGERPPGIALSCHNRIPQARGLGSSSAAIVAGVLLARALVVDGAAALTDADVLRLAARLEGHPDNVAPCLLGGFTIAWSEPGEPGTAAQPGEPGTAAQPSEPSAPDPPPGTGGARAVRLPVAPGVLPVVFVPAERGLTEQARAALPATVPHADAAFTAARAALLVHALTEAPELLYEATADRLHQQYRAGAAPATAALVAALREDGVPAVVSGAGPSVLALGLPGWTPPRPAGWTVRALHVDTQGAVVTIGARSGTVEHAERDPVAAGRAG